MIGVKGSELTQLSLHQYFHDTLNPSLRWCASLILHSFPPLLNLYCVVCLWFLDALLIAKNCLEL